MGTAEGEGSRHISVFKTNPEGVVSVRFREAEPAQQCVQLMNGR